MDMQVTSEISEITSWALLAAVLFLAPVGAFVMRRQIAAATGFWRVAGRALQALGAIMAPLAALFVIAGLAGITG